MWTVPKGSQISVTFHHHPKWNRVTQSPSHPVGIFGECFSDPGYWSFYKQQGRWHTVFNSSVFQFSDLNNIVLFFKENYFWGATAAKSLQLCLTLCNLNSGIKILRAFSFACHNCWGESEYQTQKYMPTVDEMDLINQTLDWPWASQVAQW